MNLLLLPLWWSLFITPMTTSATTAPGTTVVTVDPGGVIVWAGSKNDICKLAKRSWPADRDGYCIFPIDLYTPAGPLQLTRLHNKTLLTRTIVVNPYPYPTQYIELADDSKVNLSKVDLARVERENAIIDALWAIESTVATPYFPLNKPLDPLPPGGRFGHRRVFNSRPRNPHSGVDYPAPQGTPVLAVADGRVLLVADHFFAGNSLYIDHGDGLISMYFHLHKIIVRENEYVQRGQKVAEVGATGRATGPHLHLGIRWRGQRINPELLYQNIQALPTIR